jgi:hypothetical protein
VSFVEAERRLAEVGTGDMLRVTGGRASSSPSFRTNSETRSPRYATACSFSITRLRKRTSGQGQTVLLRQTEHLTNYHELLDMTRISREIELHRGSSTHATSFGLHATTIARYSSSARLTCAEIPLACLDER